MKLKVSMLFCFVIMSHNATYSADAAVLFDAFVPPALTWYNTTPLPARHTNHTHLLQAAKSPRFAPSCVPLKRPETSNYCASPATPTAYSNTPLPTGKAAHLLRIKVLQLCALSITCFAPSTVPIPPHQEVEQAKQAQKKQAQWVQRNNAWQAKSARNKWRRFDKSQKGTSRPFRLSGTHRARTGNRNQKRR